MHTHQRQEIEQNFRAFEGMLATLMRDHAGGFALLHQQELVGVFPKAVDAVSEGHSRFGDGVFSVQRVVDRPLDLGFLSYASGERDTI